MLNEINVVSNINLEQDVTKIMTQTNYTKEEAIKRNKLFIILKKQMNVKKIKYNFYI